MRRRLVGAGFFMVVLLAALLGMAPASWFDLALARASGGVISLGGADGSIWSGRGSLQATIPHGGTVLLDQVRWTVGRADLLQGKIRLRVVSDRSAELLADLELDRSGLMLRTLDVEFPAVLLGSFSPTLRQAGLSGTVQLEASQLRMAAGKTDGTASILWKHAASGLADVGRLGDYRIDFSGHDKGLSCRITTSQAVALKLTGTCSQLPGQPLLMDGTAEPVGNYPARLEPLLQVFGRETAPGIYKLQLDHGIRISDSGEGKAA